MPYSPDRTFTDHIHQHLAMPHIYAQLGWRPVTLNAEKARALDMDRGIDYVFERPQGGLVSVQERFREVKYKNFTDFTIRYRRDGNVHANRQQSEYFKMQADYFVYGITNGWKDKPAEISGFEKYAVVDLKQVYRRIDDGSIVIADNGRNHCSLSNDRITCPVKYNADGSSSFFPVDIQLLIRLWPVDVVLLQKGFL